MNYVVCGPPGSGKTSYVMQQKLWGDLIIDTDLIFQALTWLPPYEKPDYLVSLVFSVRDFVLSRIKLTENRWANNCLIMSGARAQERANMAGSFNAQVLVIEAPAADCLLHIGRDKRRKDKVQLWIPLVQKWWAEYQPCGTDVIIRPQEFKAGEEALDGVAD